MAGIGDVVSDLFGGGGGSDPSAGMDQYLAFLKNEEAQQVKETAQQKVQSATLAGIQRSDLLNRPGYTGTVNVGDAQQRTAATLDKQMQDPTADPTQKANYNTAIQQQKEDTAKGWRVISGQQFEGEDALTQLTGSVRAVGWDAHSAALDPFKGQLAELKKQYSWLDTSALEQEMQNMTAHASQWND